MTFLLARICLLSTLLPASLSAQPKAKQAQPTSELLFSLTVERHGVRSPTSNASAYDKFAAASFPLWPVEPGLLTPHGFELMRLFGVYDRAALAAEHLLPAVGCEAAASVSFYADSDQRTLETGRALAEGMFPGCRVPVAGHRQDDPDPLFKSRAADRTAANRALAVAAVSGRIGGSVEKLAAAHTAEIAALDHILATCGAPVKAKTRTSLFDAPPSLGTGSEDHFAEMRGPLNTASTLSENILLAYAEGMSQQQVGWGCVDGAGVRSLIGLHTAASNYLQRTPFIARLSSAPLLAAVLASLTQAATRHPVAGSLSRPSDRALFIVGHDTNLLNIAGALQLSWIADGRPNDTPPGSALIFELHRTAPGPDGLEVRLFFAAQTLEQMRNTTPLTPATPPQRVPVFIPGCSGMSGACNFGRFAQLLTGQAGF